MRFEVLCQWCVKSNDHINIYDVNRQILKLFVIIQLTPAHKSSEILSPDVKFVSLFKQKPTDSGGRSPPDPLPGLCPWTTLGDFRPPDPLLIFAPPT